MAPGRRKVGKGKDKLDFSYGDLVLAKVKGYPAWPAKICKPEDWDRSPDPKKYFVEFFGTSEIAYVAPVDIQMFTTEVKNKLAARCQGKGTQFASAVEQISQAFDGLESKMSNEVGKDIGRTGSSLASPIGATKSSKHLAEHHKMSNLEDEVEKVEYNIKDMDDPSDNELHMPATYPRDPKAISSDHGGHGVTEPVVSEPKWKKIEGDVAQQPKENKFLSSKSPLNCDIVEEERSFSPNTNFTVANVETKTSDNMEMMVSKSSVAVEKKEHSHTNDDNKPQYKKEGSLQKVTENGNSLKKVLLEPKQEHSYKSKGNKVRENQSSDSNRMGSKHSRDEFKVALEKSSKLDTELNRQKIAESYKKPKEQVQGKDKLCRDPNIDKKECGSEVLVSSSNSKEKNPEGKSRKHKLNDTEVLESPSLKKLRAADDDSLSMKSTRQGGLPLVPKNIKYEESQDKKQGNMVAHLPKKQFLAKEGGLDNVSKVGKSTSLKGSLSVKNDGLDVAIDVHGHPKYSLDRLDGNDEEEDQKTPIPRNTASNMILALPNIAACRDILNFKTPRSRSAPPVDNKVSDFSTPGPSKIKEKHEGLQNLESPVKQEQKKIAVSEVEPTIISPKIYVGPANKVKSAEQKPSMTETIVTTSFVKDGVPSSKSLHHNSSNLNSRIQAPVDRNKAISKAESMKSNPKSNVSMSTPKLNVPKKATPKANMHVAAVSKKPNSNLSAERNFETDSVGQERPRSEKRDNVVSSTENKYSESDKSMKHLIAVAQAKRRDAHIYHDIAINNSVVTPPRFHGRSLTPISSSLPFALEDSGQKDIRGHHASSPLESPTLVTRQLSLSNQVDADKYEHKGTPGLTAPGGSLSGGTEAAIAREALEGMLETLSRTKDSIGRATRLAIECAKYGIASEVVELLIRKLENEPSFHRKVDLFFLVDSITQCSHSQKGIAGSSYVPTVQAALPRLLGAAAPSGAAARENRRQCLKVLKLWLGRKIMPESVLRQYMDDIEVPSEDLTAGFFLRRPSRAERSVDDPIREMEGMLVDEYGSNASFQLPGLVTSHIFEDEDEDDLLNSPLEDTDKKLSSEAVNNSGEPGNFACTPCERRHHILEDVDGELEMEDATLPKDEEGMAVNDVQENNVKQQDSLISTPGDPAELSPSPLRPPPPLDSPPPSPPLPFSPPPPSSPLPPPPLSPPPPPPPLPPSFHPPLPPPPIQSVTPNVPPMQESFMNPTGNQLLHLPGNGSFHGHESGALNSDAVMQQASNFMPSGISNLQPITGFASRSYETGQTELYPTLQNSHHVHQFQQGTSIHQRPYHPLPPVQAPSNYPLPTGQPPASHFSHVTPMTSQIMPSTYHPYVAPIPNSQRQYTNDDQRRVHSSDFSPGKQHNSWVNGGRVPQCPGGSYVQDGYLHSHSERPMVNSSGFQLPLHNGMPSSSAPGRGLPQMLPSRPDLPAFNCWRPPV